MHKDIVCTFCIYELSTSPAFKQYIWLLKISRFEVGMVSGGSLQQKLSYASKYNEYVLIHKRRYTQSTHTYTHIHTHTHTCTQMYTPCTHICTHMYTYMYTYMYTQMYTDVHTMQIGIYTISLCIVDCTQM